MGQLVELLVVLVEAFCSVEACGRCCVGCSWVNAFNDAGSNREKAGSIVVKEVNISSIIKADTRDFPLSRSFPPLLKEGEIF